jgi:hypothetical protein
MACKACNRVGPSSPILLFFLAGTVASTGLIGIGFSLVTGDIRSAGRPGRRIARREGFEVCLLDRIDLTIFPSCHPRHRIGIVCTSASSLAIAIAADSVAASQAASCRRPLTKKQGVPFTPLRMPPAKSASTFGA